MQQLLSIRDRVFDYSEAGNQKVVKISVAEDKAPDRQADADSDVCTSRVFVRMSLRMSSVCFCRPVYLSKHTASCRRTRIRTSWQAS